jgi:hypothetical protein
MRRWHGQRIPVVRIRRTRHRRILLGWLQVWLHAAHHPNLRAGVAWYGLSARKLALLVYRALSGKLAYYDPGATAYLKLNRARELKSLRKRAKLLGFELVDRSSGEVLLNPVS